METGGFYCGPQYMKERVGKGHKVKRRNIWKSCDSPKGKYVGKIRGFDVAVMCMTEEEGI